VLYPLSYEASEHECTEAAAKPATAYPWESQMIGQLSGFALECPDPEALAAFYSELTGWPVVYTSPEWCSIGRDSGFHLSFQRSEDYRPPTWPDPHSSMQYHLHVRVPDLDEAEAAVITLGATRFADQPLPDNARVMADPVGHVFCLVPSR
jgi:catechol 2,3-dioxygenase-like lactoylglutathione lyase family enzyme